MDESPARFSRRERQIMDCLYARGEATVTELCESLPDSPTDGAVRTMLRILMDKGAVKRRKAGRKHYYAPAKSRRATGKAAMRRVVETFFAGSLSSAVAAHLDASRKRLSKSQVQQIEALLDELKKSERTRESDR